MEDEQQSVRAFGIEIARDSLTGAIYIYLTEEIIESTTDMGDGILIDRDIKGNVVGIELLGY